MGLRLNSEVIASRKIKRGSEIPVPKGTPGRIIKSGGFITLKYSVKFHPSDTKPVIVDRLTWRDVHEA
jgi:hypothetical protein